jgi:DNA-directed RNA polymerase specialized sigma24 family protein
MSHPLHILGLAPDAGLLHETPSLEELYELYREPMRRYLYRLCGSTDQAEELTQEAFIRAYTGLLTQDPRNSVASTTYTQMTKSI